MVSDLLGAGGGQSLPTKQLGGPLGRNMVLASGHDVAVVGRAFEAFSDGLRFTIEARASAAQASRDALGAAAAAFVMANSNRGELTVGDSDGLAMAVTGVFESSPRLSSVGGWGSNSDGAVGTVWHRSFWLTPYPSELRLTVRWAGVTTMLEAVVESAELQQALGRLISLWP